ncbi:hypothetical protein M8J76_005857 [Diaphorina citri]|nr:hypothetical protein M8J75_016395 [Diaphorina citri]KAI5708098.1 hypothetical protein M8J77_016458 [Diaphorina citri]KAI5708902.1 hypothetical protein M8J76_005857 [Diaphorina citri]
MTDNLSNIAGSSDEPPVITQGAPQEFEKSNEGSPKDKETLEQSPIKIDEAGISVAMKMYIAPIDEVVPSGTRQIPLQTERI